MQPSPPPTPSRASRLLGFAWTRADTLALGLMLAALALFFLPLLTPGRALFFRDIATEIVPKKTFQARSGADLLWNPLIGFGQPLAANPQESAFYPPALLFRAADVVSVLGPYVFLHLALALIFMHLLARARAASVPAAAFAALAFAGGGFVVSCGNQIVMLNSVVWLPGLVWALDRALCEPRMAVAAGLFWALQVLGGEAEIAALSGLIAAVYLASRLVEREGDGRRGARRAVTALAVALTVALGLSAVQWLLTLEYIPLSNRAAAFSAEAAGKWSLEPARLVSLLAPDAIANPENNKEWVLGFRGSELPYLLSVYPGLICALLALSGALRRRGNVFLLGAALLFVWLSLGPRGGLYFALHALPGFDRFRMPERCLLGFALLLPLLAADGLDRLRTFAPSRFLEVIGIIMMIAAIAGPLLIMASSNILTGLPADALASHLQMLKVSLAWSWALSFFGTGLFLVLLAHGRPLALILPLFLLLDLFLAHRFVVPTTDRAFYALDGNIAATAGARPGTRAVVLTSSNPRDQRLGLGHDPVEFFSRQRLQLAPFTGLELGLADAAASSSLYPADQAAWHAISQKLGAPILRLSAVEMVLDPAGRSGALKGTMDRVYVISRVRPVADQSAAIAAISASGFNPNAEAVIESAAATSPAAPREIRFARITRSESQRVEVQAAGPGWLILLDSYYPGWSARVDGQPAPIVRANGFFRAVWLDPGDKTVTFTYRPRRFLIGAAVSALTLVLAAAWFFRPGRLQTHTATGTGEI